MVRLTGGLALRATAWLVALGSAFLLWHQAGVLSYLIFCSPFDPSAQAWKIASVLAYVAMIPTIALPFGATLISSRAPRVSSMLATAAILLPPLFYFVLAQSAPK